MCQVPQTAHAAVVRCRRCMHQLVNATWTGGQAGRQADTQTSMLPVQLAIKTNFK
jgi:hypothetical protein